VSRECDLSVNCATPCCGICSLSCRSLCVDACVLQRVELSCIFCCCCCVCVCVCLVVVVVVCSLSSVVLLFLHLPMSFAFLHPDAYAISHTHPRVCSLPLSLSLSLSLFLSLSLILPSFSTSTSLVCEEIRTYFRKLRIDFVVPIPRRSSRHVRVHVLPLRQPLQRGFGTSLCSIGFYSLLVGVLWLSAFSLSLELSLLSSLSLELSLSLSPGCMFAHLLFLGLHLHRIQEHANYYIRVCREFGIDDEHLFDPQDLRPQATSPGKVLSSLIHVHEVHSGGRSGGVGAAVAPAVSANKDAVVEKAEVKTPTVMFSAPSYVASMSKHAPSSTPRW
jgi:hypothetical protein